MEPRRTFLDFVRRGQQAQRAVDEAGASGQVAARITERLERHIVGTLAASSTADKNRVLLRLKDWIGQQLETLETDTHE